MVFNALRLASTSVGSLLAYLYVGGHVQNDTLAAEYGFGSVGIDARSGASCVGGTCLGECEWWDVSVGNETPGDCSGWTLRRQLGVDTLERAAERAGRCAKRAGESCVLSHEIDFPIPAAFVWNASEHRMRPFLLPRLRRIEGVPTVRVAHVTPEEQTPGGREALLTLDKRIAVEHYDVRGRALVHDEVSNDTAFCLQLLLRTVPDECSELLPPPTEGSVDERW